MRPDPGLVIIFFYQTKIIIRSVSPTEIAELQKIAELQHTAILQGPDEAVYSTCIQRLCTVYMDTEATHSIDQVIYGHQ